MERQSPTSAAGPGGAASGASRRAARSRAAPPGSLTDRIGLAICWALGLLFCAIAVAIVVYLLVQGIKFLQPEMLWSRRPQPASARAKPAASPTP